METRTLLLTWLSLLALLAATALSALVPLGAWNSVVNLAIALAKTVLVVLVFMRLRRAHSLIRLAALVGVGTLAILVGLSATDYLKRDVGTVAWQAPARR